MARWTARQSAAASPAWPFSVERHTPKRLFQPSKTFRPPSRFIHRSPQLHAGRIASQFEILVYVGKPLPGAVLVFR